MKRRDGSGPSGSAPRSSRAVRHDRAAGVVVLRVAPGGVRVLLLRSTRTRRPLWEFPKGGIDGDETAIEAAYRELREETGLTRADVRPVDGFERSERYRFTVEAEADRIVVHKEVVYFLARTDRADVSISEAEASDFGWFEPEVALSRLRYAARRRILKDALDRLDEDGGDGTTPDDRPAH